MSEPRRATELFVDVSAELLTRGCAVRFRAEGTSMLPTIRPGDWLLVEPVAPAAIAEGDILLCRSTERPVAHRVVGIVPGEAGPELLLLQGDASPRRDRPLRPDQVLGRVAAVEREGHRSSPPARPGVIRRLIDRGLLRILGMLGFGQGLVEEGIGTSRDQEWNDPTTAPQPQACKSGAKRL